MSNLFRGLKPKAKLSRNGFDLSQKHVFSSRPGIVTPCLCIETIPRDHIEIDMANLTRTMALNTAAFVRGKFNFDFFFVPYSQLWHPFNQFIDQRRDQHSSNQKGFNFCPTISLKSLLQLIWEHKYSYEQDTSAHQNSDDIFGYSWAMNALRLLDLLGYGSFYEILNLDDEQVATYVNKYANYYVNIFRLAAYQHIWYDIYRNKYFDVDEEYSVGISQSHDYVKYFNFDDIDCKNLANSRIPFGVNASSLENVRIYGLTQLRYVQYKKDLFTSVMPSTQFGAVSSISFDNFTINRLGIVGLPDPSSNPTNIQINDDLEVGYQDEDSNFNTTFNLSGGNVPNAFDVLQLRKAEVLQRWKQQTLRAGNMVDDNFNAHFGVTSKYEGDNNVMYLGSHSSVLQINPVEQTAPAGGDPLATLGATGTSVASGKKIVFDLKDQGDYGIIMCMCYFTPENEYNALGIDKANTLYEQFDFFSPEFENIGLEAVERANYDFSYQPNDANKLLGYAPRYWMYKTSLDKVHGQFIDESIFSNFTPGSLSHWTAPRHEVFIAETNLKNVNRALCTFYVDPAQLNNVFGVQIRTDTLSDQGQDLDPFLHNVFFDVKAIRSMSVLGLPQF